MADPNGGMAEVSADMLGGPVLDEDAVDGPVLEEATVDGLLYQDAVDSLVLDEYRDGDPTDGPTLEERSPVDGPAPKGDPATRWRIGMNLLGYERSTHLADFGR